MATSAEQKSKIIPLMALDVIHTLWRKLPKTFRGWLFDWMSFWLAPLLKGEPPALQAPFVVAGAFRAPTGLGEAARLALLSFQDQGQEVYYFDLTLALKQTPALDLPVGQVLPKHLNEGTLLLFANPATSSFALWKIGAERLKGFYRLGCWVWEYPKAPKSWRKHVKVFHGLAAPSHFACEAIAHTVGTKVRYLPHPVATKPLPAIERKQNDVFTIGFMADMIAAEFRKNPLALMDVLEGIEITKPLRVLLYWRGADFRAPTLAQRIDNLKTKGIEFEVRADDLSAHDIENFYVQLDLYVSLHRCEGFGLTLAEAMARSIPVMATNWSANAEYINESNGYGVGFTLSESAPIVANVDIFEATKLLQKIIQNPKELKQKGIMAQKSISHIFCAEQFLKHLKN